MPPQKILDTHIHLWPSTSISPTDHGWMTPGHVLARRYGISDYSVAASSFPTQPSGFIYVETDRYLPTPLPVFSDCALEDEKIRALKTWAKEPLNELRFLRRIVEDKPEDGDGFSRGDGVRMLGCVIWAPFHLDHTLYNLYLHIAEEVAGPALWVKVVGFRYLLQGKGAGDVQQLVQKEDWVRNVAKLSEGRTGKGWCFDIGVDAHRDGVEAIEAVVGMIEKVRKLESESVEKREVRFVLNHLCKPLIAPTTKSWPSLARYRTALARLSSDKAVYMKLSGAFNEFSPSPPPSNVSDILASLDPYLETVILAFNGRIMFGSDWPVCNVGGPKGEASWGLWGEVVERWIEEESRIEGDAIWWKAGCEGYGIESFGGEGEQ